MSANSELSINVHVAPMRGFVTSAAPPAGIRPMWSPLCSALIAGERDAILVDTTITYDQVDRLADWVERFGKQVAGVVITRGHSDHWIGLARLQERFPPHDATRWSRAVIGTSWRRPGGQTRLASRARQPPDVDAGRWRTPARRNLRP